MDSTSTLVEWSCKLCGYLNFRRNKECRRCNATKSGKTPLQTDWICHSCMTVNKTDRKKDKTELACSECGNKYSNQMMSSLTIEMAYTNEYECSKRVFEKLGVFVDWNCLKNIRMGISNAIDLVTRSGIYKSTLLTGIQNVIMARDPDTGHPSDCLCNSCLGIN